MAALTCLCVQRDGILLYDLVCHNSFVALESGLVCPYTLVALESGLVRRNTFAALQSAIISRLFETYSVRSQKDRASSQGS